MDENRGLIGKKVSLSKVMAKESLIGNSASRTARTVSDSAELFKY